LYVLAINPQSKFASLIRAEVH